MTTLEFNKNEQLFINILPNVKGVSYSFTDKTIYPSWGGWDGFKRWVETIVRNTDFDELQAHVLLYFAGEDGRGDVSPILTHMEDRELLEEISKIAPFMLGYPELTMRWIKVWRNTGLRLKSYLQNTDIYEENLQRLDKWNMRKFHKTRWVRYAIGNGRIQLPKGWGKMSEEELICYQMDVPRWLGELAVRDNLDASDILNYRDTMDFTSMEEFDLLMEEIQDKYELDYILEELRGMNPIINTILYLKVRGSSLFSFSINEMNLFNKEPTWITSSTSLLPIYT